MQELEIDRDDAKKVLAEVAAETGVELATPLGTMIELPRAAMTAGQIAEAAEFFSFGTNDLTQTTWGFSRDDVEAAFFSAYLEMGIFGVSPFETLDVEGVGELVRIGTERGRASPAGPQGRRLRRARRRSRLGALLPDPDLCRRTQPRAEPVGVRPCRRGREGDQHEQRDRDDHAAPMDVAHLVPSAGDTGAAVRSV